MTNQVNMQCPYIFLYLNQTDKTFLTSFSYNFKEGAPCCVLNPVLMGTEVLEQDHPSAFLPEKLRSYSCPFKSSLCFIIKQSPA